jgi:hypothetical protein
VDIRISRFFKICLPFACLLNGNARSHTTRVLSIPAPFLEDGFEELPERGDIAVYIGSGYSNFSNLAALPTKADYLPGSLLAKKAAWTVNIQ